MREFSLLIKPTSADCNLRCDYCFYLNRNSLHPAHAPHRMTTETLEHMVSSFMALPMKQYAFGWQGGEPALMGVEFFRTVTALQQKHGRAGAVVANALQTNATLIDDEFARHLAEYRFLAGVSLDGPAQLHDRYRTDRSRGGSHSRVLRGIECLQRHGVEHNVLVLVSRANVRHARAVYRYLVGLGLQFHQYIPCVEFDSNGVLQPYAIDSSAWGEFLCELYDTWREGDQRRVSIRMFDSIVAWESSRERTVCTMGRDCRHYFVVEYNGDIYPCDFFVEPSLRIGNVASTPWAAALDSPLYRQFGARKTAWHPMCATCEYLELCAGDCPKHRWPAGVRDSEASALCSGWKRFYRHAHAGLRELARTVAREKAGESGGTAVASQQVGAPRRNSQCPCGSGRKYKHCCGTPSR